MRTIVCLLTASALALSVATPLAAAAGDVPEALANLSEKDRAAVLAFERGLHPRSGTVAVPGAHASLNLGDRYAFLPADEAKKVLVNWGNAPQSVEDVLGLVMPKGQHSYDDGWAAVLTYEDSGHIKDDDAASQDYDGVLADMRAGEEEGNEEIRKSGYPGSTTVGWAQAPTYDQANKTLIWARNIKFDGAEQNTLNYDVRKLGRTGVLSMNLVDTMPNLPEVKTAAAALAMTASFDRGQSYADYDAANDQTAEFGLAGLVAAGAGVAVAKKAGLLAILLLVLKKGFVFVIAGLAAGGAWLKRKFGKGDDAEDEAVEG